MKRRDFLRYSGHSLVTAALADGLFLATADAQTGVPIDSLRRALPPNEAQLLLPGQAAFQSTLASYNRRVMKTPQVRVLVQTDDAVAATLRWAQENNVPLAMRSGGHSYEGFSGSTGVVIDTRLMNKISMSDDSDRVLVGAGAALGQIYAKVADRGRAIPAGTCPTVGVTGHTTGGGFGLLARTYGLACDSLVSATLVNARGEILTVSDAENRDLFWAIRGAGSGSFGVVTNLTFRTHRVRQVSVFGASWSVPAKTAAALMKTWQQWAPQSPAAINTLIRVSKGQNGTYNLRCVVQCDGPADQIRREMERSLFAVRAPAKTDYRTLPFIGAVKRFAGSDAAYPSIYMKAKSDYLDRVMSDEGLHVFLTHLPAGMSVMFDAYGAQVSAPANDATAFVHRRNTLCSLQYYMQWEKAAQTDAKLKVMRDFHDRLRPYMSGRAYFNYCDLDLKNWAEAYWGANLERLKDVKTRHDPENFFRYAQSVPRRG